MRIHPGYLRLLAVGFVLVGAPLVHAVQLVHYGMGSNHPVGLSWFSASSVADASAINASDIIANNLNRFENQSNQLAAGPLTTSAWDVDNALAAEEYFSVTITAQAGYSLELDSFTFQANGGGTRGFYVFTSPTGGWTAENLAVSDHSYATPEGGTLTAAYQTYSVSLGAATLAAGESAEFRFYLQRESTANAALYFDNLILNGSVAAAIPEPSSYALLASGAMGLFAIMRRRRR